MKVFISKYFAYFCFFVLGALSMWGWQRLSPKSKIFYSPPQVVRKRSAAPFFDPFGGGFSDGDSSDGDSSASVDLADETLDPFAQMRSMRQHMLKQMKGEDSGGSISQREDAHFIYYDISIQGLTPEKVKIEVRDGQISVSGQVEKKSDPGSGQGESSYFSSSFHRSFPAPSEVDPTRVVLEQGKDKITLKFPK